MPKYLCPHRLQQPAALGCRKWNQLADWKVVDAHHVLLRAQRAGNGNGRIYTITITGTNNTNGLSSSRTVTVRVPHDQGN